MITFISSLIFIASAIGVIWYFVAHDRGQREPIRMLWLAGLLGLMGIVMAVIAESILLPFDILQPSIPPLTLFQATLTIGIIEETCKFLPLAFFLYHKDYFNEYTDGVIYFAIAGFGFGLPENLLYVAQFGGKAGLLRLIMTPLFHAAMTGMVGYFLARSKVRNTPLGVVAVMLMFAMVLHGFYDFGLLSGRTAFVLLSMMITAGLSVGLFLFYLRATEHDQELGLSAVGHNKFCRHCGAENAEHTLYCSHCGQYV